MNASTELWSLYQTTERRMGSTPLVSTPKSVRPERQPETPNVTCIENYDGDQNENIGFSNDRQMMIVYMKKCEKLKYENERLSEIIEKQEYKIRNLTALVKSMNSTSELESSESANERSASVSLANSSKSTKIQRVTPTKRIASSSGSSTSTPVARPTTESDSVSRRSARASENIQRQSRRAISRSSPHLEEINMETPLLTTRRFRPQIVSRTPLSVPSTTTRPRDLDLPQSNVSILPQVSSTLPRRTQHRRRLVFESRISENQRTSSEPDIEHLAISPVKDDSWKNACPPRVHLERNRPEFINRLEARQRIIRAASEKRAQIEQSRRNAARAVAQGIASVDSVRNLLFADSTKVQAFYRRDMRDITMRNVRNSQDYKNVLWRNMETIDKAANRILAHTHNVRTRSTSRPRIAQY